jgi:hypothetical protein
MKYEFAEPLWVMSDLDPGKALRIYLQRMEGGLSGFEKPVGLGAPDEQVFGAYRMALRWIAYAIGRLIEEQSRVGVTQLTRCPPDAIMRAGMPVSGRWPRGMPSSEKLLGGSGLRGRGRWATPVAGPLALG